MASVALSLGAQPLRAQEGLTLDAQGMYQLTQQFLMDGRVEDAGRLTEALLQRDPQDPVALLLSAEVAFAGGRLEEGRAAARAAHAATDDPGLRFQAARLVAFAHAEAGQDTRAMLWLRRALPDAPSDEAVVQLRDDYNFLRDRNPLSVQLSFGITPASNINGGSASDTVRLIVPIFGEVEFELIGASRALSGIQFSGGVTLAYRLAETPTSATLLQGQFSGRTYALSPEAQRQAPDDRGSDFADYSLTTNLTHRWVQDGWTAPASLSFGIGQTWYDDSPFVRFARLSADRSWQWDDRNRLRLGLSAEWQERLRDDEGYGILGFDADWTRAYAPGTLTLSAGVRDSLTDLEDVGSDGLSLGATWDLREPVAGFRLGFGADADYRHFDATAYGRGDRTDLRLTLRTTVGVSGVNIYGFEPTITLEASETDSDVDFFDRSDLRIDFGFRSTF